MLSQEWSTEIVLMFPCPPLLFTVPLPPNTQDTVFHSTQQVLMQWFAPGSVLSTLQIFILLILWAGYYYYPCSFVFKYLMKPRQCFSKTMQVVINGTAGLWTWSPGPAVPTPPLHLLLWPLGAERQRQTSGLLGPCALTKINAFTRLFVYCFLMLTKV